MAGEERLPPEVHHGAGFGRPPPDVRRQRFEASHETGRRRQRGPVGLTGQRHEPRRGRRSELGDVEVELAVHDRKATLRSSWRRHRLPSRHSLRCECWRRRPTAATRYSECWMGRRCSLSTSAPPTTCSSTFHPGFHASSLVSPPDRSARRQLVSTWPSRWASSASAPAGWVMVTDVEAEVESLDKQIRGSPQAAVVLAQVLRVAEDLGPLDALVAESLAYSTLQGGPGFASWLGNRRSGQSVERSEPEASVLVDRDDDRLTVTLSRPHVRNAVNGRMRDELCGALAIACADPSIRSVDLRGAGTAFSSGGDLDEFGSLPDPTTGHLARTSRSPARLLATIADRATAHVHGACVGAGIELAAFAAPGRGCARRSVPPAGDRPRPHPGCGGNGQHQPSYRTPTDSLVGAARRVHRRDHGTRVGPRRHGHGWALSCLASAGRPSGAGCDHLKAGRTSRSKRCRLDHARSIGIPPHIGWKNANGNGEFRCSSTNCSGVSTRYPPDWRRSSTSETGR